MAAKPTFLNIKNWTGLQKFAFFIFPGFTVLGLIAHSIYYAGSYANYWWHKDKIENGGKNSKEKPKDHKEIINPTLLAESDEIEILNQEHPKDLDRYFEAAYKKRKELVMDDIGNDKPLMLRIKNREHFAKNLLASAFKNKQNAKNLLDSRLGEWLAKNGFLVEEQIDAFWAQFSFEKEQKMEWRKVKLKSLIPDLTIELTNHEKPETYISYVRTVIQKESTLGAMTSQQKLPISKNLLTAALNNTQAAASLLGWSSLTKIFTYFSEVVIKNIFNIHRRVFLTPPESKQIQDTVKINIQQRHGAIIADLNEENAEFAEKVASLIVRCQPSESVQIDELKLLFDYLKIEKWDTQDCLSCGTTRIYNPVERKMICDAFQKAMESNLILANYILCHPLSVELFQPEIIQSILKIHFRSFMLSTDFPTIKQLHQHALTQLLKNAVFSQQWLDREKELKKDKKSEAKEIDLDVLKVNKKQALKFLNELKIPALVDTKEADFKLIMFLLSVHREEFILRETKDPDIGKLNTKYKDYIVIQQSLDLTFLKSAITDSTPYNEKLKYIKIAFDYRKSHDLANKLKEDSFKIQFIANLMVLGKTDLVFAKMILNSALENQLTTAQTIEILKAHAVFTEKFYTDDPVIIHIRSEYQEHLEGKEQPVRGAKKALVFNPKPLTSSLKAKVYLATGTYDPPQPGHLIPHLEFIYQQWQKDLKSNPKTPKPIIYFSPSHDDYQLDKRRKDGRIGFNSKARLRILNNLIDIIKQDPKYATMDIKPAHDWEAKQPGFVDHPDVYLQVSHELKLQDKELIYLPGQDLYDGCCNKYKCDHQHMTIQPIPRNNPDLVKQGVETATGPAALASMSSSRVVKEADKLTNAELLAIAPYNYWESLLKLTLADVSIPSHITWFAKETAFTAFQKRIGKAQARTEILLHKEQKKTTLTEHHTPAFFKPIPEKNLNLDYIIKEIDDMQFAPTIIYGKDSNVLLWLLKTQEKVTYSFSDLATISDKQMAELCATSHSALSKDKTSFDSARNVDLVSRIQQLFGEQTVREQYVHHIQEYDKITQVLRDSGIASIFPSLDLHYAFTPLIIPENLQKDCLEASQKITVDTLGTPEVYAAYCQLISNKHFLYRHYNEVAVQKVVEKVPISSRGP